VVHCNFEEKIVSFHNLNLEFIFTILEKIAHDSPTKQFHGYSSVYYTESVR